MGSGVRKQIADFFLCSDLLSIPVEGGESKIYREASQLSADGFAPGLAIKAAKGDVGIYQRRKWYILEKK